MKSAVCGSIKNKLNCSTNYPLCKIQRCGLHAKYIYFGWSFKITKWIITGQKFLGNLILFIASFW
jgi:hypothetical protein